MAMAIPLGFALGAGALTGWSTTAMAVGWLVGSWLYTPKSQQDVVDPGPNEMPTPNQALRGATMPVLFGTNRCPVQVIWQNNFTSIRNETKSASGGKMGGSGMGSKGAAPAGGDVSYTYKWDLLFHAGMTPEAYSLFGGWIGRDRISAETIAQITMGYGAGSTALGGATGGDNDVTLNFDEGFYHPGGGEDDNWSHLTSNGVRTRWPHTAWLGFKQLFLGGQPVVPQLNLEIGPGAVTMEVDSGFIVKNQSPSDLEGYYRIGNTLINGKYVLYTGYQNDTSGNFCATYDVTTGTLVDEVTFTELEAYLSALSVTVDLDEGWACALPGTNYVLVHATNEADLVTQYFFLAEVEDDGTMTLVGSYRAGSGLSTDFWGEGIAAAVANDRGEGNPIVYAYSNHISTSHHPVLAVLPTITQFKANITSGTVAPRIVKLTTIDSTLNRLFIQNGADDNSCGWFESTVSLLGAYSTRFYYFASAAQMQGNDPAISSVTCSYLTSRFATYPQGMVFYCDMGAVVAGTTPTVAAPVICNDDFVDGDGITVMPFDDDQEEQDGSSVDAGDNAYVQCQYRRQPSQQILTTGPAAGATLYIFTKDFGITPGAPNYQYSKARAFIYSPLEQTYIQYAEADGNLYSVPNDIGSATNGTRSTDEKMFYRESSGEIFNVRVLGSSTTAADGDIVFSTFGDLSIGGGDDVLPPYIIKEILTNPVFGINPRWTVDDTSYQEALQYCQDEEIFVSTMYRREESVLRIIELLLATYGGFLTRSGGTIYFKLQDASGSAVRTIDNDHLVSEEGKPPVKVTKGALQDTFNKIRVNYLDRALAYRQNQVEISDEVDIDLFGVRMREFPPQFVMSEQTANKIAVRGLWSNLYARDRYDFVLGWKDCDLEPGDVITLVDSFHTALQSGVRARITSWRESRPGMFDVSAIMELEYANNADVSVNSSTFINSLTTGGNARPPHDFRAYELPAEFSGSGQVYVGWADAGEAAGAHLYLSPDNVTFARALSITPYPISGRLNRSLPAYPHGWFDENVEAYFFTASGFSVNSPEFGRTFMLDDVSEEGRALGAGLIWVGSEMMAYEDPTLIGSNHYRFKRVYRGWGGTHIHAHNSGDYFHKHGSGVFAQDYNEDKIGTILYYKVVPFNFAGVEYNVSSIVSKAHTIQGAYYRPQVAGALHTFVDATSEDLRGNLKRGIGAGSGDLVFEWRDGARMAGFGAGGYGDGTGGFGRFTTDALSHSWRVEVIGSGNAVVRSTVVTTAYFAYTRASNASDNGAFRPNIAVKVTPFGAYGDAPRTSVVSLELFEQ